MNRNNCLELVVLLLLESLHSSSSQKISMPLHVVTIAKAAIYVVQYLAAINASYVEVAVVNAACRASLEVGHNYHTTFIQQQLE